jgi:hypothetical protein
MDIDAGSSAESLMIDIRPARADDLDWSRQGFVELSSPDADTSRLVFLGRDA